MIVTVACKIEQKGKRQIGFFCVFCKVTICKQIYSIYNI